MAGQNNFMIKHYLSLVKFSHTVFALPFAFIGFFMGVNDISSTVPTKLLLLVILCMIFARSAAMAFNRYLDRDIDAMNPRTANTREIPKGIITPRQALIFTVINGLFFIATTYFINKVCFYLSPVALLIILGYSYTKRFTSLCHIILGIGLGLAPAGAYLAVNPEFSPPVFFISLAVICWVSGFDIIYSLQDEEFDRKYNLYSIPSMIGKKNALTVSRLLHTLSIILLTWAGLIYKDFQLIYYTGVLIFGILLMYQQSIVKHDDLSRVNHAFFTVNGIASVIFSIFVITELLT